MKKKVVPFYFNTEDNERCFQAVIKSALRFFYSDKDYSFEELDRLTGKKEGLWTWPTKALLELKNMGLRVRVKEVFDWERFIKQGKEYLIEKYGKEAGERQIKNSNISYEQELAKKYVKKIETIADIPTLEEVKALISDDWIVLANVNFYYLYGKSGYSGHFVLILQVKDKYVRIHDPGLPPKPGEKIPKKNFLKAWGYPDEKNKNYVALKNYSSEANTGLRFI